MATKTPKKLNILKNDPWLEPYAAAIEGRHQDAVRKERELLAGGAKTLSISPTHTNISACTA